jgi:subtilisin family serine protease
MRFARFRPHRAIKVQSRRADTLLGLRRLATIFVLLGLALAGLAPAANAAPVASRYVVILRPTVDVGTAARSHARRFGSHTAFVFRSVVHGYAATIPAGRVASLRRDPRVVGVYRDRVFRVAVGQTIPTGVRRIGGTAAGTASGVNVAVIDTGIDYTHPDLAANMAGGVNCTSRPDYGDEFGHGSHVAGIIAARDNATGVRGVAPGAKLWSVRVLDNHGYGTSSSLVCGLDFVDAHSPAKGGVIKIANMSLAAPGSDDGACGTNNADPVHQAICRVVADGVAVVAAAGNANADFKSTIPASYDEVITATALADSDGLACGLGVATSNGSDDTFATFSNYATLAADAARTIGAPGVDILSTFKNGGYAVMSGTSMAAPHVAGAAARYVAAHPSASPATIRTALRAAAEPKGVNVGGLCVGGLGVSHADPSNRHPEPELRIVQDMPRWARLGPSIVASTVVVGGGSPAR